MDWFLAGGAQRAGEKVTNINMVCTDMVDGEGGFDKVKNSELGVT